MSAVFLFYSVTHTAQFSCAAGVPAKNLYSNEYGCVTEGSVRIVGNDT